MHLFSAVMFSALYSDSITLPLISENNLAHVETLFQGFPDSEAMVAELRESYEPEHPAPRLGTTAR